MSTQKRIIEVTPPRFQEERENIVLFGYRCPACNGRGGYSEQTGLNVFFRTECKYCQGSGKIKAEIQIFWKPE